MWQHRQAIVSVYLYCSDFTPHLRWDCNSRLEYIHELRLSLKRAG